MKDWGNWQEREVLLGQVTVGDGTIRLYVDDDSVNKATTWNGMRIVRR